MVCPFVGVGSTHPLPPKRVRLPPWTQRGSNTPLRVRGYGDPIRTTGQKAWHFVWYTHKTSGFKTSGFKTSETSGLQNVRFTKCQVYKTSGLQNVRLQKRSIYILYLWLVKIRRFCCSHASRQSDGCVLFSILEGVSCHISP